MGDTGPLLIKLRGFIASIICKHLFEYVNEGTKLETCTIEHGKTDPLVAKIWQTRPPHLNTRATVWVCKGNLSHVHANHAISAGLYMHAILCKCTPATPLYREIVLPDRSSWSHERIPVKSLGCMNAYMDVDNDIRIRTYVNVNMWTYENSQFQSSSLLVKLDKNKMRHANAAYPEVGIELATRSAMAHTKTPKKTRRWRSPIISAMEKDALQARDHLSLQDLCVYANTERI